MNTQKVAITIPVDLVAMIDDISKKSVDENSIKEKIGTLPRSKMDEVHGGLRLIMNIP